MLSAHPQHLVYNMSSTFSALKWLVDLMLLAFRALESSGLRRQRRRSLMLALNHSDLGVDDWADCGRPVRDGRLVATHSGRTEPSDGQSHSNYDKGI